MESVFYVVSDGSMGMAIDDVPMLFKTIGDAQEWLDSEAGQISCKKFNFENPCVKAVKLVRVGW